METTAEGLLVSREVSIAAPPETVWSFLVNAERATRWMGVTATIEPRRGGTYRVEILPGQVVSGSVLEVDPPRRLVHTWGWLPGSRSLVPVGSTVVEYLLAPTADGGTRLRLTHRRLPDVAAATAHAEGWEHYLPRLQAAAAGRQPGPDPWIEERR
jgi:uncharacterized protein YndB with AHSA1/START domain